MRAWGAMRTLEGRPGLGRSGGAGGTIEMRTGGGKDGGAMYGGGG